jgi:hypothetical protein
MAAIWRVLGLLAANTEFMVRSRAVSIGAPVRIAASRRSDNLFGG